VYRDPLIAPNNGKKDDRTIIERKERAKNEASETVVHLPAFALDALKRLPQGIENALVFSRADGTPSGLTALRPGSCRS
jgi:hypothetical protein